MGDVRHPRTEFPGPMQYARLVQDLREFAVFMLDPHGRITSWNAGAARILGYGEEEIIGQPFSRVFSPEDVAAGVPERELASAAKSGPCGG